MTDHNPEQTHFTFPCEFPIKIMGDHDQGLDTFVETVIRKHIGEDTKIELNMRESRDANYVSVTALFKAESKAQLEAIYQEITANPHVKMAL